MEWKNWKKLLTVMVSLFCFLILGVIIKAYLDGRFESVETLQNYIKGFGIFAPLILILIQALQVIVPVLPGFLGCAVGAVLFGSAGGFWCNYIGICAGSIIAFLLAKKYGVKLVEKMFPKEQYEKYSGWAGKSKSYIAFLFWEWRFRCFRMIFSVTFPALQK